MKRSIDELRWHCGPHACEHVDEAKDLPPTWRYSVIGRDYAVSLCVSKTGGEFRVHMPPGTSMTSARAYPACDLLGGPCDIPHPPSEPPPVLGAPVDGLSLPPRVSPGLLWWSEHATGGVLEQPERFWRAFERRARELVDEVRSGRYQQTCCPRCHGKGTVEIKPKRKKGAA